MGKSRKRERSSSPESKVCKVSKKDLLKRLEKLERANRDSKSRSRSRYRDYSPGPSTSSYRVRSRSRDSYDGCGEGCYPSGTDSRGKRIRLDRSPSQRRSRAQGNRSEGRSLRVPDSPSDTSEGRDPRGSDLFLIPETPIDGQNLRDLESTGNQSLQVREENNSPVMTIHNDIA